MVTRTQKPRAILFDAVGTLIYPSPPVPEVYGAAGDACGCRLSTEEVSTRFKAAFRRFAATPSGEWPPATSERNERSRWRAIVRDVFHEFSSHHEELFEILWRHFARSEYWRLYDDVAETWRRLTEMNVAVGIASNFDQRLFGICRDLLPACEERNIFVSSRVGFAKPHPDFFRSIEHAWGVGPRELMLVGDDEINDFAGAAKAGWHALLLDRQQARHDAHVVHRLADVFAVL